MTPLGPITHLTIHCAATPEGRDVKAPTICDWDRQKFGQVSYHYVIELDGTVVTTLSDTLRGAHVAGHNTGNVGVCYVGGMDAGMKAPMDTRTAAQREAMAALVARYRQAHRGIIVQGHRDWPNVAKACPSFDVKSWLTGLQPQGKAA